MKNRCLILTEAGDQIGLGHLTRCSAILHSMNREPNAPDAQMWVHVQGDWQFNQPAISHSNWMQEINSVCQYAHDYQVVLVDSYLAESEVYRQLHDHFRNVVVIDDYNRLTYHADIVLNPNASFEKIAYAHSDTTSRIIGGPEFVILRDAIGQHRDSFRLNESVSKLFLTIGGDDIRCLLPKLIASIPEHIKITTVTANEKYRLKLEDEFRDRQLEVFGLVDASTMAQKMTESDLAISACGQTLNELAFLGVPTIGICIDKDQLPNLLYYVEQEFLPTKLLWDDDELAAKVAQAIDNFEDREVRRLKSKIGKRLVTGQGIQNICKMIDNL